jgi:hypothetical protein
MHPSGLNNDLGLTARYGTAIRLAGLYQDARTHDLTQGHSAQYAMRCTKDRQCHNRHTPMPLDSYVWYYVQGTRTSYYDVSYSRMVALISSAIGGIEFDPACLDLDNAGTYLGTLYLAQGTGTRHRLVTQANNNYRTITGQDGANDLLQYPALRHKWLQFKRGRDLFILGPFDISRAVYNVDIDDACNGLSPYNIIANGYAMPHSSIAQEIHTDLRLRQYVRQYRTWFNETNYGHWYEISHAYQRDPSILGLPPQAMHLRALAELQSPMQDKLLPIWPWVTKQNPIKQLSDTDRLEPVSTYEDLKHIGAKLHNCAANYGYQIQTKQALLVTYYRQDKPIALCHYDVQGKIQQALGSCNRKLDKVTTKAFQEYQPTF